MAGFFNNEQDDDFDLVDGKEDREGGTSATATAPRAPNRVPAPKRPTSPPATPVQRPAAPRIPARPPKTTEAPQQPAVQRPALQHPAQAQRPAAPPAKPVTPQRPAPPARPAAAPQPKPEAYEYEEPYSEKSYAGENYEESLPAENYVYEEPEPDHYHAPARRRTEPEYSSEAEALFTPPQPKVAEKPRSSTATATKEKKPASGWAAILGLGGSKDAKTKADSDEKRRSRWSGRRKPLIIQIVLVIIALIVGYNGLVRMFGPSEGPTYDQVQAAARDAVGVTGFPTEEGSAVAVGFAKTFFEYSADDKARTLRDAQLLQYVNADGLNSLDANYPVDGSQAILDGPYLTSLISSDATHGIATVSMTLQGAAAGGSTDPTTKVVFVSFPLDYNGATNTISVAGSPTFVPPTNVGGADEAYSDPKWETDPDVVSSINESLLSQFFTAWGQSSTANLNSLLAGTKATTLRAKSGLHGAVSYVPDSVTGTIVESAGTGESSASHRRFQTTITWQNDVTKAQYAQTYRGWIVRQPSGSWTMEDVNNAADFPASTDTPQ